MGLPISGPLIQEAAKNFALKLGKTSFTASNGWLECFKQRHQIVSRILSGESLSADANAAVNFISQLKAICEGYEPENIFNADETALFFRALPNRSLVQKFQRAVGQKFAKERITVFLGASMAGEKLKSLIIGKAKKPRCFKNIDVNRLPVIWKSSAKSWMTIQIFEDWLTELNKEFIKSNRKILLFVDNCSAHSHAEFSNIKLHFLPENTTSLIQPLDQGIIKIFKTKYRKRLLQSLLAQINNENINKNNFKKANFLDAVYWVEQSWSEVKVESIINCFKHAGFTSNLMEEIIPENTEDDLQEYISRVNELNLVDEPMEPQNFIIFDDLIPASEVYSAENLVEKILEESYPEGNMEVESSKLESEDEIEPEIYCPTNLEFEGMLEQMIQFALTNEPELLSHFTSIKQKFVEIKIKKFFTKVQTTLDRYFSP